MINSEGRKRKGYGDSENKINEYTEMKRDTRMRVHILTQADTQKYTYTHTHAHIYAH